MKRISILKHNLLRAAMTLALIMTCATAWATNVTVTYNISADGIIPTAHITRADNSSLTVEWQHGVSTLWPGNEAHGVDDEYDITFMPNHNLNKTSGAFATSNNITAFTVEAGAQNYYIKSVTFKNGNTVQNSFTNVAPNMHCITVVVPKDVFFNAITVVLTTDYTQPQFSGGSGTQSDPYLLGTSGTGSNLAQDLATLRNNVNNGNTYSGVYFKIGCANYVIGLAGLTGTDDDEWYPIAKDAEHPFMGHFDGNNNHLGQLFVESRFLDYDVQYAGFFGYIMGTPSNYAEVTNISLKGDLCIIEITPTGNNYYAGMVAAYVDRFASVTNCTIGSGSDNIKITTTDNYNNFYAGGLVGYFYGGDNSRLEGNTGSSKVNVTVSSNGSDGTNYVGGLVGYMRNYQTVNNNFVKAETLSASGSTPHYIGAIAGGAANLPSTEPNNYFYTSDNNITGIGSSSNTGFGNTRVWKITCPNNLSVTSSPATTISGTKYYGVGSTVTVSVSDPFYSITSLSASAGSISSVSISSNGQTATFTVGNSGDITLSANISATTSGTTSDGLTWTLSGTGYHELTISGNGTMSDYGYTTVDGLWRTNAPWGWHITKVTVGNGVTSIGKYAFVGCQSLGNVTLGSGLTSIGQSAFDHCDAMTVITLPANVTTLGSGVFAQCVGLQRVNFMHDGAVSIGSNNIFTNCNALQYLVFPSPAGAMANTTGNWSGFTDKLRASLGNQIFKVTNEGGTNAYDIATATDLNNLSTAVNGGANGSGQTFRQTADITVNNFTPIGSSETNYFGGTYDGGNNTLNVTISDTGNQGTALFRNIQGATIKNLILTGSVTGTIHAAALVGFSRPGGTNSIDCCKVAANVTVNTATNNNYHCGGVVGHALTSTLNISKTLYCGTITNSGNYVGGFQGWSDGSTVTISNCLFAGTYTGTALFHPIALRNTNSAATAVASNTYYDKIPTATNSNLIAADGKKTTAVTTAPSNLGSTVATLSYMTVYQNGILYNGNYYAAPELPTGGTNIYLINNAAQWTAFCDMLYDNVTYNRFKGKTVKLGADITVTRMAGGSNHDFCGSFDGQNYTLTFNYGSSTAYANEEYIAPFSYVSNVDGVAANINNLKVAGTIYTSAQFAAGLVGAHWGDVNIQNCRVSTVINSSVEGDGTHGGIVGVDRSGTLTITGCVFDGQLLGSSTNACGGIVGFRINSATTNIYYTLFAPTNLTIGTDNSATFIRNATNSCKDGCYYTQEFNDGTNNTTNQGQKAYAFTTQPANIGTLVQNYSMVEAYTNGLKFNDKYYVNLGSDLTINADGTEYTIHNATGWDLFCGLIESGETFSGKTVKLDADISVSRMAGLFITNNNKHAFSGAFNGQNHTLTFTCNTASSNYVAPFGYVKGGNSANGAITISNLNVLTTITAADYRHIGGLIALQEGHVNVTDCNANVTLSATKGTNNPTDLYPAGLVSQVSSSDNGTLTINGCTTTGTIATDGKYAAGMVGVVQGSAIITNSVSSVTINSSTAGDGTHGGYVAVASSGSTTITGCLFNGKLLTVGESDTGNCGGFVGWRGSTLTISNCLYAPATLGNNENEVVAGTGDYPSCTFARNWTMPDNSNNYFTRTLGTEQGKQQHSITAGENVTVVNAGTPEVVYNTSGITSYGTGIKFNNVLYAGEGDNVSLTLSLGDLTGYTFNGYTVDYGTLSGNDTDGYTLTMPDNDVTITAKYCAIPTLALVDNSITAHGATVSWTGTSEGYTLQIGSVVSTETVTLLSEGFEGGIMPNGWTIEGDNSSAWAVGTGNNYGSITDAHDGNYNAIAKHRDDYEKTYLIMPALDLGVAFSASISLWYSNEDYGTTDGFGVYYRVDGGNWNELFYTQQPHDTWTEIQDLALTGLAANYEIGFLFDDDWGRGVTVDDVVITAVVPAFDEITIDENAPNTYTFENLVPETTYKVRAIGDCGDYGNSQPSNMVSFTTDVACPAPTIALVDNSITGHSATVSWTGTSEGYTLQIGSVVSTETVTLLSEGFEGGVIMPSGWSIEGDNSSAWSVGTGNGGGGLSTAHTGSYNALSKHHDKGEKTYLITPAMDLSQAFSASISLWYSNEIWGNDINGFGVYYRVDGGIWVELFYTKTDLTTWTEIQDLALPNLAANYEIGFLFEDNYGREVTVDDVVITATVPQYQWTDIASNATSPYTINNLEPETTYYVRAIGNCGSEGNSQPSNYVSFTTDVACPAPTLALVDNSITPHGASVSWTGSSESYTLQIGSVVSTETVTLLFEGFEGGMPSGWSIEGDNSSAWAVGTGNGGGSVSTAHTGSYNALSKHRNKGEKTYLITPAMDLSQAFSASISLWYSNEIWWNDINGFGVYYRVNGGIWTELFYTETSHDTWTEIQDLALPNLAANYEIGFLFEDNWGRGVTVDDVVITATIPQYQWTDIASNATSPYTITTFDLNTTYSVRVIGNCGSEGYSQPSNVVSFTTECGSFVVDAVHPFTEDFEGADFLYHCWDATNPEPTWAINASQNHTENGSRSAFCYFLGDAYFVMPDLQISNKGNAAQLTFWSNYEYPNDYYKSSVVLLSGNNETELWSPESVTSTWEETTIDLTEYMGQTISLAFKYEGYYAHVWYVDDVEVKVIASATNQVSELSAGWNWWTPMVSTDWDALQTALDNHLLTVKSKDGVITTGTLAPGQMYKIRISEDCVLTITGLPTDVSVTIAPGYNWFGYTGAGTLSIATALGSFTPAMGDKIISQNDGFAIFNGNGWEGTLAQLVPGRGYVYVSKANQFKTLTF